MRLERLRRDHNREGFSCGKPELDEWFRKTARQAADRAESSTTFVLTEDGATVLGFFSLSVHSVTVAQSPEDLVAGHPSHLPVSAILLGRMAVATDRQREGLGERLLSNVVHHALAAREYVAIRLLVVDALDVDAARFYEQYGFVSWPAESLRLFARIRDIAATFGLDPDS